MAQKSAIEQFELLDELQPVVEQNLNLLLHIDDAWQASDYLPDFASTDWVEGVRAIQRDADLLDDDVLGVLVGNTITEEALPNYAISLNRIARDTEGDSTTAWARWMRGWVAEENRHGDLLNTYLRLTGRVDMHRIEITIQHLIARGFNPRATGDPIGGLIYPSFQERATIISHAGIARLAAQAGAHTLATICKKIAADESRHEQFYTRMVRAVFDRDPETSILVFRKMMKRTIAMPAKHMFDGKTENLFDHFAAVAQRLGVYTIIDYAHIIAHLVRAWDVAGRSVSGQAAKAQEFLCVQAERLEGLADSMREDLAARPTFEFPWILSERPARDASGPLDPSQNACRD